MPPRKPKRCLFVISSGIRSVTLNKSLALSSPVSTYLGVNCASPAMKSTFAGITVPVPSRTMRASSPTFTEATRLVGRKTSRVTSSGLSSDTTLPPAPTTFPGSARRYSTIPSKGALTVMSLLREAASSSWASARSISRSVSCFSRRIISRDDFLTARAVFRRSSSVADMSLSLNRCSASLSSIDASLISSLI